ncbi:MAG: hypothetical protein CSA20_03205 [Deltaproteobacteria bacterium]|nr:MAG: hypothetical protein CSA20_03205 [Deltaproteobacteria bacterium]
MKNQFEETQREKAEPEQGTSQGVKQFTLRPGLQLSLIDIPPTEPTRVDFELFDAPLEFSYHLSGRPLYCIAHDEEETVFNGEPGLNVVSAFPHSSGFMEIGGAEPNRMIAIHLEPNFFTGYFKEHLHNASETISPVVERLINEECFSYLCQQAQLTPSMTIIANQLLSCPYRGILQQLFLESKTLELIVLQLEMIACSSQNVCSLAPKDIERVHMAKNLLVENILTPPGLFQLARAVSLSHTKLNQGFRHEFGVTVFEYLRQYRLKRGKELLDSLEMNVTEVAYATGFSSPSHFAKAFRNHYKVKPSSYLKEIQQRKTFSLPPFNLISTLKSCKK